MHVRLRVKFARCVKGVSSSVAFGDTFPQGKAYKIARLRVNFAQCIPLYGSRTTAPYTVGASLCAPAYA